MRNKLRILVLGGARSGKSTYAQTLVGRLFKKPLFLATAREIDREMRDRITHHRQSRGPEWTCVEEPINAAAVIVAPPSCDGILMDCTTVWLGNLFHELKPAARAKEAATFLSAFEKPAKTTIVVGNEVGMGIVPHTKLGRTFRDEAGRINRLMAEIADAVILVVAGLPLVLKDNRTGCPLLGRKTRK